MLDTTKNARGARVSGALGCLAAPLLIWLFVVGLSSDPAALKIVLLGVALCVGGWGAFRLFHPSRRALRGRSERQPIPEGATYLQRLRFANAEIRAEVLRSFDEKQWAPLRAQAMNRPYRVVRDFGDRLTVTPPSPTPWRRKSEWWEFWPGMAERKLRRGSEESEVRATSYRVDSVEIGHDVWTNGHGSTDHLRVKGPGYSVKTVVSLEYYWNHGCQLALGNSVDRAVSPSLAGPAAESGLPNGVGDGYESADIGRVAPTILALSRLITDTTGRPINILVGSCRPPYDVD
jgi:hypothetical protein